MAIIGGDWGQPATEIASNDDGSTQAWPLIIAVDGVAPGIGKSTVATALAARLAARGFAVDHFREEDILTRPAYGAVAKQFRDIGRVEPRLLLEATASYLADSCCAGVDVVVVDSLLPFIPSLLAWGHDRRTIATFVQELTDVLRNTSSVLIYLDGPVEQALDRAVRREGETWLPWLIGRFAGAAEPVTDLASLCGHLKRRRQTTLPLLSAHGWNVVLVEDAQRRRTEEIVTLALDALRGPWRRR